jgi:hypothetical protein
MIVEKSGISMCLNKYMGTLRNTGNQIIIMSPNIVLTADANNVGNMRVYDKAGNAYVFNGMTANDLVMYFGGTDDEYPLAEEMLDVLIGMDTKNTTQ